MIILLIFLLIVIEGQGEEHKIGHNTFHFFSPSSILKNHRNLKETNTTTSSPLIVVKRLKSNYKNPKAILKKGYFVEHLDHYKPKDEDTVAYYHSFHKNHLISDEEQEGHLWVRCTHQPCRSVPHPKIVLHGHQHHYYSVPSLKELNLTLQDLLDHEDILIVAAAPKIKRHSWEAQSELLPLLDSNLTRRFQAGLGEVLCIPDTSLDPYHCAFYDPQYPSGPPDLGVLTPSNHTVIDSWVSATGWYGTVNGAHGTGTSGEALGRPCVGENGVSPAAKLAFYQFASPGTDNLINLPSSFLTYLLDVTSVGGAGHVSASWGIVSSSSSSYTILSSWFDEVAFQRPYVPLVAACGNDNFSTPCTAPANGKNVECVGAAFSQASAYTGIWTDASINPSRYTIWTAAGFSSSGPLQDGRRSPLFWGPGVFEVVPYAYAQPTANHAQFEYASGTSEATPAIAALNMELQRLYKKINFGQPATSALIKAIKICIAEPIVQVMNVNGYDGAIPLSDPQPILNLNNTGYGFPVLSNSTYLPQFLFDDKLTNRTAYSFTFIEPMSQVIVGFSWTDMEILPLVTTELGESLLVNDLDIRVYKNGEEWFDMDRIDDLNTQEQIIFNTTEMNTIIRLVVYEKSGVIQGGVQKYGLALSYSSSSSSSSSPSPSPSFSYSGTCLGGEYLSCGINGFQYCDGITGNFSSICYEREECNEGGGGGGGGDYYYYYYNSTSTICECIPGTLIPCSSSYSYQTCLPNATSYSTTCYSLYQEGFVAQPPTTYTQRTLQVNDATDRKISTMMIIILTLHTFFV